jgi:hypothetical protein
VTGGEHVPGRPSWDCEACGEPWPCGPAKVELVEEYGDDRTSLAVYLAAQLQAAIDDYTNTAAPVPPLFDRFFGWDRTAVPERRETHPGRVPAAPAG